MAWTNLTFAYGSTLTSTKMTQLYDNVLFSPPAGTIIAWSGSSAPDGYLACPTAATNISRTTYAALFAAIGTQWGAGDGSTTFGMPYFPADFGMVQAGTVGSLAGGSVISHSHTGSTPYNDNSGANPGAQFTNSNATGTIGVTINASGGTYNYGAGMRVLFCVKYRG